MSVRQKNSVLVTGGRGFVGRAVVRLLRESGSKVISLDQAPITPNREQEEISCDISNREQLQRIFEQGRIESVIHLAAVLPTAAQSDPVRATQVNVVGSLNLLELAREFAVGKFVFASSLSIYGTWDKTHVVSETDRAAPEDLYGAAKLYVEQLGAAYRDRYAMDFVSLRIGRVIGPGARSTTSAWRSQMFEFLHSDRPLRLDIPYAGSERVLVVNVEDIGKALVALSETERTVHCVYNAPCESVIVQELKKHVERLNPNITVKLGDRSVQGNPRLLDFSRFQAEFCFRAESVLEQLRRSAGEDSFPTAGAGVTC